MYRLWANDSEASIRLDRQSALHVGVVGAGYVSAYHLRTLKTLADIKVVGVADLIHERSKSASTRFGIPGAYNSIEEMLEKGIDVLHVLTPVRSHFELALKGLEAGSHVFVEKPFVGSIEQCERLIEEARIRKRRLCVNHSLLGDPTLLKALELVRCGAVGNVVSVQILRTGPAPPRPDKRPPYPFDGDPFREVGVHALYQLVAILGLIRDASCMFRSTEQQPAFKYDEWSVQLDCEKGLAQIHLSWNGPLQQVMEIRGDKGRSRVDLSSGLLVQRRSWKGPKAIQLALNPVLESVTGVVQVVGQAARYMTGKVKAYQGIDAMIRRFYRVLLEGGAMPVSHSQVVNVVTWTERIASLAEPSGRSPSGSEYRCGAQGQNSS